MSGGIPEVEKFIGDFFKQFHLDIGLNPHDAPAVVTNTNPPQQPPTIVVPPSPAKIVLVKNEWPRQDPISSRIAFWGDPCGGDTVNSRWYAENMVDVVPPWKIFMESHPVLRFKFHKKAKDSLDRIFAFVWDELEHDQTKVHELGLDVFDGAFNYRAIRGSENLSNHAFGIALDLNAAKNPLGAPKGTFTLDHPWVKAMHVEGWRWGGDYKGRKDLMHFEACS